MIINKSINRYQLNEHKLHLKSDIAGENPIYIYLSPDKSTLLYSKNIVELLDDSRVPKPLKVSDKGISFLLQSGVVPPPYTVYEDIFIVGIGDTAKVHTTDGKVEIEFSHEFPFLNDNRLNAEEMTPDTDEILSTLAKATIDRIDPSKPTYLFHSAGKDSNTIALALAKAGYQDKVTLITHKSKGDKDESEISKSIAQKLGFKHEILYEVDELQEEHYKAIDYYFTNAPLPCMDNVTLAYPLYSLQIPKLNGANIIDGMGNDVYIGHIPSKSEYKRQKSSNFLKYGRVFSKYFKSESLLHMSGRTRCEHTGLTGMSYSDVRNIFPQAYDVHNFWKNKDSNVDYLEFRADIRGCIIDQEIFTRKVRNFSDSIQANLVLPFATEQVATYFSKMQEKYLFNRNTLKNKLILREMLKIEIGLDSDKVGKMGFEYDLKTMLLNNLVKINKEIYCCKLWDKKGLDYVIAHLLDTARSQKKYSEFSSRLVYRIYLLSSWINKNKYINISDY